nr:phosphatidylglycerophosphatase A [Pseudomonadota bacterium]
AAFFLVLLATPLLWQWQLAAFVLFRILDAAKPFPIGWFDRRVKGGLGIMLDDLVAALLTVLILSVFYWQVAIG